VNKSLQPIAFEKAALPRYSIISYLPARILLMIIGKSLDSSKPVLSLSKITLRLNPS
jgi:hypothetical protein